MISQVWLALVHFWLSALLLSITNAQVSMYPWHPGGTFHTAFLPADPSKWGRGGVGAANNSRACLIQLLLQHGESR